MTSVLRHPDVAACRAVLIFANKQDEKGALKSDVITQHLGLGITLYYILVVLLYFKLALSDTLTS
jgi:hypothetical protein